MYKASLRGIWPFGLILTVVLGCSGGNTTSSVPSPTPPPSPSLPTFGSVVPVSGPAGGGTALAVSGTNFRSGVVVTLGGVTASSVVLNGASSLTLISPPHAAGAVDLVVKNSDGTSATGPMSYTYANNPIPAISSTTPSTIAAGTGDTQMTIIGTGYTEQSSLQLNGAPLSTQYVDEHQLTTKLLPSQLSAARLVRLTVTNPGPGGGASDSGPAFSVGPSIPYAAYRMTLTTLQDGRILLCGGENAGLPLSSAAIFNPATNSIVSVGPMTTARYAHTATLLPNGKVLIAGGSGGNDLSPLNSAETFDPATSTFTATANMNGHRDFHTATVLQNGKVLLAGSYSNPDQQTAEVYDPVAGTFTAVASMTTKRANHSAVLLPNGTVLILGGLSPCAVFYGGIFCTGLYQASAEVYDPPSNSFAAVGQMHEGRSLASAVLLKNGKVFVVGGEDELNDGPFLAVTQAEVYDPSTKQFTIVASSAIGFWNGAAVLLQDGRVLVCGGHDAMFSFGYAQVFDPASQTFSLLPPMNTPRLGIAVVLLPSGSVGIFGGSSDLVSGLSSSEIFSPTNAASEFLLPIQNPVPTLTQLSPATTVAGDTATLSGTGFTSNSEVLVNGESVPYTLSSAQQIQFPMPDFYGTFSILVSNPPPGGGVSNAVQQTSHVTLSADPGQLQALPGSAHPISVSIRGGGSYTASVREGASGGSLLDGTGTAWFGKGFVAPSSPGTYHVDYVSTLEPQATATATITVSTAPIHPFAVSLQATHGTGLAASKLQNGKILVVGGGGQTSSAPASTVTEVFDPNTLTSTLVGSMAAARAYHTATTLQSGHVLVTGGSTTAANGNLSPVATTEIFDPSTSSFSAGPQLSMTRSGHFAFLLPSGDVLVIGGCSSQSATTTEIYRVNAKAFQAGPIMKASHCQGKATALASGQLLLTGGIDPSTNADTGIAEVYDPTGNTFTAVGTMLLPRDSHAATLLPDGRVIVTGGLSAGIALSTTEYYDPASKAFSQGPSLVTGLFNHAAVSLPSGTLFVVGGGSVLNSFETDSTIVEAVADTSTEVAVLDPRQNPIALSLSSTSLLILGGFGATADIVTMNTPVANPPAPSISRCSPLSSTYVTCTTFDLRTPITAIVDGVSHSIIPYTSDAIDVNTYPQLLTGGSHSIQMQNPDGQLSNKVSFVF